MRIYSNAHDLMSEMGRELNSYGAIVKPKHYQNKCIDGNDDFITKEIICQQYCLTKLPDSEWLFVYSNSKEWADAEFKERVEEDPFFNPGEAWKLRKDLWEQFLNKNGRFDYTYHERMNYIGCYKGRYSSYLETIIELLRDDQDTRKAVLSIFDPEIDSLRLEGQARIPCSMYYDFLIRWSPKGEKVLHICYHQRSSDFVQHFGNDVYLAWRLMEYVAKEIGILPGYLYHTIDSLHAYKKDWNILSSNIDHCLQ